MLRAKEVAQVHCLGSNELEKQVLDAYQQQLPRQQCTHSASNKQTNKLIAIVCVAIDRINPTKHSGPV